MPLNSADRFRILTVRDCAELLGISNQAVYRAIQRGDLRTIRLGRSVRIRQSDLSAFLSAETEVAA